MTDIEEMGPIDYLIVEWTGRQPNGEALPYLLSLVESGIVRILDMAFLAKDEDGTITAIELSELDDAFTPFDGVSSGLLDSEDIADAGAVLEPGTSAAILVWENRWAAPFAHALRRNGAQVVATGRIPISQLVAATEALARA